MLSALKFMQKTNWNVPEITTVFPIFRRINVTLSHLPMEKNEQIVYPLLQAGGWTQTKKNMRIYGHPPPNAT